VLVGPNTKVVVQVATGREGNFHLQRMLEYGTKVVAGVTPGKGGAAVRGVPVYDTVEEAVRRHGANASVIFAPAELAHLPRPRRRPVAQRGDAVLTTTPRSCF
jgi:succinyl-CoA synthetase alpha subunit